MLKWEDAEDEHGVPIWLRYLDCGPWGLIFIGATTRWIPTDWYCRWDLGAS